MSPSGRDLLKSAAGFSRGYAVGDHLTVSGSSALGKEFLLVVFIDRSCQACTKAKPMLPRLAVKLHERWNDVSLKIAAMTSDREKRIIASEFGFAESQFVSVVLASNRTLRAMPTVMLVDNDGKVRFVADGLPEDESELIRIVADVLSRPMPGEAAKESKGSAGFR